MTKKSLLGVKSKKRLKTQVIITSILLLGFFGLAGNAGAATFKTINGEVLIEAENYTSLSGKKGRPWKKAGSYLLGPNQKGNVSTLKYSGNNVRANYVINFQTGGQYVVHFRGKAQHYRVHTSDGTNGYFAAIDNKRVAYGRGGNHIKIAKIGDWTWQTDAGGNKSKGQKVHFTVSPGKHTFSVVRRDNRELKLDKIWLSKKCTTTTPNNNQLPQLTSSAFLSSGGGGNIGGGGGGNIGGGGGGNTGGDKPDSEDFSQCSDGIDNDGDGKTDCDDIDDCANVLQCNENNPAIINDGFTNNQSGWKKTKYTSGKHLKIKKNGMLQVALKKNASNVSGEWYKEFNNADNASYNLKFSYKMDIAGRKDRCTQVVATISEVIGNKQHNISSKLVGKKCGKYVSWHTGSMNNIKLNKDKKYRITLSGKSGYTGNKAVIKFDNVMLTRGGGGGGNTGGGNTGGGNTGGGSKIVLGKGKMSHQVQKTVPAGKTLEYQVRIYNMDFDEKTKVTIMGGNKTHSREFRGNKNGKGKTYSSGWIAPPLKKGTNKVTIKGHLNKKTAPQEYSEILYRIK